VDGSIPVRVYGILQYDIGYFTWYYGKTGFCFEHMPVSKRGHGTAWDVCNKTAYTYAR
jgi:hypothetical protein